MFPFNKERLICCGFLVRRFYDLYILNKQYILLVCWDSLNSLVIAVTAINLLHLMTLLAVWRSTQLISPKLYLRTLADYSSNMVWTSSWLNRLKPRYRASRVEAHSLPASLCQCRSLSFKTVQFAFSFCLLVQRPGHWSMKTDHYFSSSF